MKPQNDILISCTVVGNSMKVVAIEESSQVEISIVVPSKARKEDIKLLVLKKLNYVKSKQAR